LPVGGLKEKILAAHRADIEENVPESVKTEIRFLYVESVNERLHEVFRGEQKDTCLNGEYLTALLWWQGEEGI
jgi:ATP-dependent Lon protease